MSPYLFVGAFADGTRTHVNAKPSDVTIRTNDDGNIAVRVEWCRKSLNREDAGWPITYLWPGTDRLLVTRPVDDLTLADGVVTSVAFDHGSFVVRARASTAITPLSLTVAPDTDDELAVIVAVDNGRRQTTLDFGDGSDPVTIAGAADEPVTHTYAEPGSYTITATDVAHPDNTDAHTTDVPIQPETDE